MYNRIISLAPSNTEIIYALGAGDRLIACTRYCDFPANAKQKPKIGGWLDVNDKLVSKLSPDLILTSTFVQDKISERYKKMGMNIVALMPSTLDGIFDSIIEIGRLLDKENEAEKLIETMKLKIEHIKKNSNHNKNKPRVYIEEWHKPPHVSGNWVPRLVEIAGGDYELISEGTYSRTVSDKEIQDYDPQIIFCQFAALLKEQKQNG